MRQIALTEDVVVVGEVVALYADAVGHKSKAHIRFQRSGYKRIEPPSVKSIGTAMQPMPVVKHQLSREDRMWSANLQDVHKLDDLLAVIGDCSPADETEFAQEHLRGARTCMLGAMPIECELNLELASETLARMKDTAARRRAQKLLANLSKG